MVDQASSLRQLKERVDRQRSTALPSVDEFLQSILQPTPFPAILLIGPEEHAEHFPPLHRWLPDFLSDPRKACLWDIGGMLPAKLALGEPSSQHGFPTMVPIETPSGPLWILPPWGKTESLVQEPEAERIRFLKQMNSTIGALSELWVALPARSVKKFRRFLPAMDLVCVVLPFHPDALLRGYETVKSLHLLGYSRPIAVLVEQPSEQHSSQEVFTRLASTAKRFLSLDLHLGGVVQSGQQSGAGLSRPPLREVIEALPPGQKAFLLHFADEHLYPRPESD